MLGEVVRKHLERLAGVALVPVERQEARVLGVRLEQEAEQDP